MLVSTRGRYAMRLLLDLAAHGEDGFVPLREVAERQAISPKYLERIVASLVAGHLIEGAPGKGGGYRLSRPPSRYTVGEVLRLTEGDLAPVACLACGAEPCERAAICQTLPLWRRLGEVVGDYLDGITLADVLAGAIA